MAVFGDEDPEIQTQGTAISAGIHPIVTAAPFFQNPGDDTNLPALFGYFPSTV
jgi:hypothetical protein